MLKYDFNNKNNNNNNNDLLAKTGLARRDGVKNESDDILNT